MKKYNIKGFTLIELLLAMAIFLLVITAAYKVFEAQQQSYIAQEEVAAMQQNLRAGMYMISRDVRMANAFFGEKGIGVTDGADGVGFISGVTLHDNYNNEGYDIIDIAYASFNVNTPVMPKNDKYMPTPSAEMNVGTDSMDPDGDGMCPPEPESELNCFNHYCQDKQGGAGCNILTGISDGINSNFMIVTQVQDNSLKLQHHPVKIGDMKVPINYPANKNWPANGYQGGSHVFKIKYISYRIMETDETKGHPSLSICFEVMPTTPIEERIYQPIAENIEDLQVSFLFADGGEAYSSLAPGDTNYVAAMDNGSDADPTNDFDDLVSLRVSLVARSNRIFPYYHGQKPALENREAGETDNYMRRVYTTELVGRNFPAILKKNES